MNPIYPTLPNLLGTDQEGHEITLEKLHGKKFILYVYPKDNTAGCTAEACSLRDAYEDIHDAGYTVIGVSKDSAASHQKFITKHSLPFPLIADTELRLLQALNAWGEKKLYGKTYMGALRTTFIVDEEGHIEKVFYPKEIKTKIHAQQILDYLKTNKV